MEYLIYLFYFAGGAIGLIIFYSVVLSAVKNGILEANKIMAKKESDSKVL